MTVGIGRINPADCPNGQRLLAEADRELYRRKRDRKAPGEPPPSVGSRVDSGFRFAELFPGLPVDHSD